MLIPEKDRKRIAEMYRENLINSLSPPGLLPAEYWDGVKDGILWAVEALDCFLFKRLLSECPAILGGPVDDEEYFKGTRLEGVWKEAIYKLVQNDVNGRLASECR